MNGPLSENVVLDDQADIAMVYGIKIAGALLRVLGEPTPDGRWFRIVKIEDGTATIEQRSDLVKPSETAAIDPGTEKILRDLLDRIYKMNLMAIPALRVSEQDPDSNDPLVAWMSDVRKVLYGGTKPEPDIARLT